MRYTKKTNKRKTVFTKKNYNSGDGMLTTVWGPSMWHYLHTMSFNYPVHPTQEHKIKHREFIENLKYTLPCKYCRINLKKNLKVHPLKSCHLKNREAFSKWVYSLHELINRMLKKKSGLTYCEVRDRYENFRARCSNKEKKNKLFTFKNIKKLKKEKGCTEPLYGKKAKCVIHIIPQDRKCKTLKIDKECVKKK